MEYYKRLHEVHVDSNALVKVTEMGCITHIKYMSSVNLRPTVRKISKDSYIVLSEQPSDDDLVSLPRDDVITLIDENNVARKYIKHHYDLESKEGKRTDNKKGLLRTFNKLRNIINANASKPNRLRWCTFTYAENMMDSKRLYCDWKNFNGRFKRWLSNYCPNNCHYEYIVACEPQGRGAWHMHVLFIFDKKAPFIPNSSLRELWGNGIVNIQAVKGNTDDIGRYLTAYLTDVVIEANDSNSTSKKHIKGGRLSLYPTGFNFFRCSRGVKRPSTSWKRYKEAVKGLNPFHLKSSYFFECAIPSYIDKVTNKPKIVVFANWYYSAIRNITNPVEALLNKAFTMGIPVVENSKQPLDCPQFSEEEEERINGDWFRFEPPLIPSNT
jgi:hypothetical protein